jgi:hypothetical protein
MINVTESKTDINIYKSDYDINTYLSVNDKGFAALHEILFFKYFSCHIT